jgi:hypothetical protein
VAVTSAAPLRQYTLVSTAAVTALRLLRPTIHYNSLGPDVIDMHQLAMFIRHVFDRLSENFLNLIQEYNERFLEFQYFGQSCLLNR